ncbi:MAG: hypothetical protein PVF49_08255 [Anaerolineales bacterium]|jgi:hypothetical protein
MDNRRKIKLLPSGLIGLDTAEEREVYGMVFGLTDDQVTTHKELRKYGRIYLTQNSRSGSEFHVVVRQGGLVPQQHGLGVEIVQIVVKRVDGKDEPYYWEDLQDIKDAVVGREREALELFPAHFRRDHSMSFRVLWGILSDEQVPIGWTQEA